MSVHGIQRRMTELGRIRLGDQVAPRGGKRRPRALDTFRLTSASQELLTDAARLYGGTVQPWEDAPSEGYYELTTTTRELDVLLPPLHDASGHPIPPCSVAYEHWQGGTCERRCDGITEQLRGEPCLCAAEMGEETPRACKPVTRLLVILPRIRGLGVWRLEARGYQAAATLPAAAEMLSQLTGHGGVLRLERRAEKRRNEQGGVETLRYTVPVLDYPAALATVLPASGGASPTRPPLPATAAEPTPPLAAGGDEATPAPATPVTPPARPRPNRPGASAPPAAPSTAGAPTPGSAEDRALARQRVAIWRIIRPLLAARQPGRSSSDIQEDGRALLAHLAGHAVESSRDLTAAELAGIRGILEQETPGAEAIVDEWLANRNQ